jgi:hypothetical protein
MTEPAQLSRGKRFQKIVQADFVGNTKDGTAQAEATVDLRQLTKVRQATGRADILIAEDGDDFVTILEIKATDWDRIKPKNIKRNLWSHQRQIFMYIDKYVDIENLNVCPGIIYPYPPTTPGLRELVESYLESYGAPADWYTEIATPSHDLGEFVAP